MYYLLYCDGGDSDGDGEEDHGLGGFPAAASNNTNNINKFLKGGYDYYSFGFFSNRSWIYLFLNKFWLLSFYEVGF